MNHSKHAAAKVPPGNSRPTRSRSRTRSDPQPRARHRARTWLGVIAAVLLSVGVATALGGSSSTAPLDPDSATPTGSLALANLLEDGGTAVTKVRTLAEAAATERTQTLLIVNTSLISESAGLELIGTAAKRTVVVGTDGGAATIIRSQSGAEPNEPNELTGLTELTADCRLPEAQAAGSASFSHQLVYGMSQRCFPGTGGAGLLFEESLFILADGSAMMNENLAEAGNAALSLNLLSATGQVIWFIPSPSDLKLAEGRSAAPADLLPSWIAPVLMQALLVFGVLAIWKGRRLGPLVRQPLPIVVPAHETDEGYAGLLQRNKQAGVAATALREASMTRLASVCDLPMRSSPSQLVGLLSDRSGQSAEAIADVLWERQITTDAGLTQLHAELNLLEESTRLGGSTRPEDSARSRNQPD